MPLGLTPGLAVTVAVAAVLVTAVLRGPGAETRSLAAEAGLALVTGGVGGLLLGMLWLAWRVLVLH